MNPRHDQLKALAKLSGDYRLNEFQKYCKKIKRNTLKALLNETMTWQVSDEGLVYTGPYLFYVLRSGAARGLSYFVDFLVAKGALLTGSLSMGTEKITDSGINLVHASVLFECGDLYHYFKSHGVPVDSKTTLGESVLTYGDRNYDFFIQLLDDLQKVGLLDDLASHVMPDGKNIFNYFFDRTSKVKFAYQLFLKVPRVYRKTVLNTDQMRNGARAALGNTDYLAMLFASPSVMSLSEARNLRSYAHHNTQGVDEAFNSAEKFNRLQGKLPAVDIEGDPRLSAIALYIKNVLNHRENLQRLVTRLSRELEDEIKLTCNDVRLAEVSSDYDCRVIDDYIYPIPKLNYKKLHKHAHLPKLLLSILRQHDIGWHSTKWFGFVPEDVANPRISQGDFFIESQFGIGVLHGKYSHMIQWVLLIYAIEEGLIPVPSDVTVKALIACLVEKKSNDGGYLWQSVLDSKYSQCFTFSDPYRVCSLIAIGFFGEGCAALERAVRDSFCSDYLQWLAAYNEVLSEPYSPLDFQKLLHISYIHEFATSKHLFGVNNRRLDAKFSHQNGSYRAYSMFAIGNRYSTVIEKDYEMKLCVSPQPSRN